MVFVVNKKKFDCVDWRIVTIQLVSLKRPQGDLLTGLEYFPY